MYSGAHKKISCAAAKAWHSQINKCILKKIKDQYNSFPVFPHWRLLLAMAGNTASNLLQALCISASSTREGAFLSLNLKILGRSSLTGACLDFLTKQTNYYLGPRSWSWKNRALHEELCTEQGGGLAVEWRRRAEQRPSGARFLSSPLLHSALRQLPWG